MTSILGATVHKVTNKNTILEIADADLLDVASINVRKSQLLSIRGERTSGQGVNEGGNEMELRVWESLRDGVMWTGLDEGCNGRGKMSKRV